MFYLMVRIFISSLPSDEIFSVMPASINASLGSTIQFHCTLFGSGSLYWLIDGTPIHSPSNGLRGASSHTVDGRVSTLVISALQNNDNITIHCVDFPNIRSEPAFLRVQGKCVE